MNRLENKYFKKYRQKFKNLKLIHNLKSIFEKLLEEIKFEYYEKGFETIQILLKFYNISRTPKKLFNKSKTSKGYSTKYEYFEKTLGKIHIS